MTGPGAASAADLVERVRAGNQGAIARAITWCEAGGARADDLLGALPARSAHVVGLTGPPGAGKSTLVGALVRQLRADGRTVGVVAVDPSSPLTGGALLGDRVRLEGVSGDHGVFFRSLASRGGSGGLSDATRAATRVLSAAGFDLVLVETVGAGQSEVDIMRVADTVVVVLNPGAGDEMQALKAGIMEIADLFVLNKADLPGAGELKAHLVAALRTKEKSDWRVQFLQAVATTGAGVAQILAAVELHRRYLCLGTGATRADAGTRAELVRQARAWFASAVAPHVDGVLAQLSSGQLSESAAVARLVQLTARDLATDRDLKTE